MTTDTRAQQWLDNALARAIRMERDALEAHRELTPHKPLKRAEVAAAPTWLEPNTRPIADEKPCGFVRSMIERRKQPVTFFRSYQGKPSKGKAA